MRAPVPAEIADQLLALARTAGADAADVLAVTSTSVGVSVRNGALDEAERSERTEVGLRALIGQKQATVSTSDLSEASLRRLAERAVDMARLAPDDATLGLADPSQLATEWDVAALELDDPAAEPAASVLQARAVEAEAAARAVSGVSKIDSAGASYGRSAFFLAATNGFRGGYARTGTSLHCTAITGEGTGMERDYAYDSRVYAADLDPAAAIGRLAGERAVLRHSPRKVTKGSFPVLYDERVASGLIGHLISAINGAAIVRGASWLRDAMGEPVLPDALDLTEEPLRRRGLSSRPVDAEGLACRSRNWIDQGKLTEWVLDLGTARKLGRQSTGNAARGTSSGPSPSTSNLRLTPGTASPADLIRDMKTGLIVTSMLGASINPTTGDYSRGCSGFWVENGEIAYPVNECTIAGNLRDMLRRITPANDGQERKSHVVPSLLVDGLTVA